MYPFLKKEIVIVITKKNYLTFDVNFPFGCFMYIKANG